MPEGTFEKEFLILVLFSMYLPFSGLRKYNTNTKAAEGNYLGCPDDLQSLLGGSLNNLERKQTRVFRTMLCRQPLTQLFNVIFQFYF